MNQQGIMPLMVPDGSFKAYLFGNRRNRIILWIAAGVTIVQFVIFKYFYPTIHFVAPDTFGYLTITQQHLDLSKHAVGYASFLRLVGFFASSDTVLAAIQYLLIQSSALLFLLTLFFFYRPGKVVQAILLGIMILNPLCLSLANLVSGDGVFLAISLVWVASLLWIVHRPTLRIVIWHFLVLLIALTIRYNAFIYPAITVLAFILSTQPVYRKLVGIGASLVTCGIFIVYTANHYKDLTGTRQYAPLGGWVMASNALYVYRHVDSTDRKPVPAKFKVLDNMVQSYFDSTRSAKDYPIDFIMFIRPPGVPLVRYMDHQFRVRQFSDELEKWVTVAPLYFNYGTYIAQQYPWRYARYLLWPNINKYFVPPTELLQTYSFRNGTKEPIDRKWFEYDSGRAVTKTKSVDIKALGFYPTVSGIVNMLMLGGILGFAMLRGFTMNILFRKGILLVSVVWFLNAGFAIFASYSHLHFQAFPLLFTAAFAVLLVEWLWKMGIKEEGNRQVVTEKKKDLLTKSSLPRQVV